MPYKTILLIDDDEDDREIFQTALENADDSVAFTSLDSGPKAIEALVNGHMQPDLIFLDLNMPVMNGHQVLSEIRKHEHVREIPVIVFSTSSHVSAVQASKELGATDFISKPGSFFDLVEILRSVLR